MELKEADKIKDGDELEIDIGSGIIKNVTQGKTYKTEPFPKFLQEVVREGGLMNYIKRKA
jgi:3-isopropylmalate/(R)-2-methylmalate dehydratase small subunit